MHQRNGRVARTATPAQFIDGERNVEVTLGRYGGQHADGRKKMTVPCALTAEEADYRSDMRVFALKAADQKRRAADRAKLERDLAYARRIAS